ncbi:MAG: hypothetical protein QXH54_06425 [Methanothermobacter sp.]
MTKKASSSVLEAAIDWLFTTANGQYIVQQDQFIEEVKRLECPLN